ncbi:MAG: Uma2 family endonuclease [Bacteroidales bacterium]|nr:Uma2 family endonuclease [Bacteroidales bacterium]
MKAPLTRAPITAAATDLPRRAFSVAEVERMVEVGLLLEDERLELIGGELVMMSPKGIRHEVIKKALVQAWIRQMPPALDLVPETTFRLSPDTYLEPDIVVFDRARGLKALNGETVLLAVEIADSSLGYDLARKPRIYSAFGVRELWVIDAVHLVTHVHRDPAPLGYRDVVAYAAYETLTPLLAPALPLTLTALDLAE